MNRFEGKNIIVTGGTKGIGKILAKSFFDEGAKVLVCGRNVTEVENVCREIDGQASRFFGLQIDVSNNEDCKKLMKHAMELFGRIDVLINNAGTIGEANLFEDADLQKFTKTITTNLLGTVYATHAVIPFMKNNKAGKIINLAGAGVGSKKTLSHFSAYYTSKSAVVGFSETIADELQDSNIQVNCISPGAINTNITDHVLREGPEKVGMDMYERTLKQKESGGDSMEKVVSLVHFLASSESDNVTGRLLSAKWNSPSMLKDLEQKGDKFKLRRIDDELFYGKEK